MRLWIRCSVSASNKNLGTPWTRPPPSLPPSLPPSCDVWACPPCDKIQNRQQHGCLDCLRVGVAIGFAGLPYGRTTVILLILVGVPCGTYCSPHPRRCLGWVPGGSNHLLRICTRSCRALTSEHGSFDCSCLLRFDRCATNHLNTRFSVAKNMGYSSMSNTFDFWMGNWSGPSLLDRGAGMSKWQ